MQSKIIAAAVASTAAAIKLEAPTTMLAQAKPLAASAGVDTDCHGTYMYQCMQKKVDDALGFLTNDAQDRANLKLLEARNTKDQMVHDIQDLRNMLEMGLAANRKAGETAAYEQMRGGMQRIEDRLAAHVASLRHQVLSDSPRALRRKEMESLIKNIYYSDEQELKLAGREPKKAAIKALLEQYIAEEIVEFGAPELEDLTALVEAETEAMCDVMDAAMSSFNYAAAAGTQQLADAILAKSEEMDELNAKLIEAMDARVAMLNQDFLKIFWETVEDIYRSVRYEERAGLIWKALYQKDAFIAAVTAIRDQLVQDLADNKTDLVNKMNAERDGMAAFIAQNRSEMLAKLTEMKQDLIASGAQALQDLKDEIERLAPQSPSKAEEDQNLKDFIYDMAVIRFNPNDSGNGHANGVQPYGEWVARRISDNIANAFHDTLAEFDAAGMSAVEGAQATLLDQEVALMTDNMNAQNLLNAQTADLRDQLSATRNSLELDLSEDYKRITSTAEAEREADQIAMTTAKNEVWKKLSWIIRQTLANSKHNHGYRAGPVFGFRSELAQVSADGDSRSPNPFTLLEKPELQGWGAEGPEDGYNPYGYGDWGWGFGPSQTQYKEVSEQLDIMEATWAATEASHAARMKRSREEMEAEWAQAWDDLTEAMAAKWAQMTINIDTMNTKWAETLATRTAIVEKAVSDARKAIADAYAIKLEKLDAEEKEIRWAITSIWNYDRQHALNEALTAARDAADAECDRLRAGFKADLDKVLADWAAFVVAQQTDLDANTAAAVQSCEDSKAENSRLLEEFKDQQKQQYADWEAFENADFARFMAESREAFHWIKASYCLKHGTENDVTSVGYGCSWGTGAGVGNAGYKKGIEIEAHMESLTYGQDPIDIKHIHDEAWLIDGARAWTMQGVPEEYQRQLDIFDGEQARIQATIDELRQALQARLTQHEADANQRMDDLANRKAAQLLAREDKVIAEVDGFRLGLEAEVDAFRVEVQWGIKELVWQLGYTQGYKFGGHDGEDANIMAQITDLKDQYEALIQKQTALMNARVQSERDAAELAYAAAQKAADDLQDLERILLDEAIAQASAEFEAGIAQGDLDCEAAEAAARAGLKAFIDARLAAWQELYDQEEINAKWQEDSYYRLSLLRLLNEKQAAIDKAVAETYAAFDADLAARKSAQADFNASERDTFYSFVAALRNQFEGHVQANDDKMADIIQTRRDSMNARLDEQLALFNAAMAEDRAEMKRLLKEIYNYNTHDLDATATATGNAAPWSVEQHNGFMAKLHYWSKAQLNGKAAMLQNMRDEYAATEANMMDQVLAEKLASDRRIEDLRLASQTALERLGQDSVNDYANYTEAELAMLQDFRAALEAETAGKVEAVRKNVIYAMHVLRYAGGYDVEQTGFGKGASSFHTVGNYLTGVAELDDFRLPNRDAYAQVADKINSNDDHHVKLEEMLMDSVASVNDIIQAARDEMSARVAEDEADALAEAQRLIQLVADTGNSMAAALADLIAAEEGAMQANNAQRKADMQKLTDDRVAQCKAINDTNIGKVEAWIGDRLAWADKMMDGYQKKHLIKELKATKAKLVQDLEDKTAEALADQQNAMTSLCDKLDAAEAAQQAGDARMAQMFANLFAFVLDTTTAQISALLDEFNSNADAELAGFMADMDQLLKNWAYWLKYFYGFQGYETSIYQDFDPSQDYTDIMGYPKGDGAYPDLGTQGPDLGNSGEANLPAGGYGTGGRGASDYIYSGDHTALAYGKDIGPDPQYFDGSILDPSPVMKVYREGGFSFGAH